MNSKKLYHKKITGPATAYVSPASSGNSLMPKSKVFNLGSAESFKERANVASNSINRKKLISKPIVPPHLKTSKPYTSISANVSPKDQISKKVKLAFKPKLVSPQNNIVLKNVH